MAKTQVVETTDPFAQMESVSASDVSIPRRGRAVSETTLRIREALEKSLEDGTVRSIPAADKDIAEDLSRKIRAAAQMKGKDHIKVSCRFDSAAKKLVFGPDTNFKPKAAA